MEMRQGPHKNRSRTRGRRPINQSGRVYESNGPDVKVRGTAQTVADKYLQLARDAHSAGDPVMAEGYFQHAEHYLRILAASQPFPQQNHQQRRPGDDYAYDDGEDGDDDQPGPSSSDAMANGEAHRQPQHQQQHQQHSQPRPQPLPQEQPRPQPLAQEQPRPQPLPQEQPRMQQPQAAPPVNGSETGDQPWGGPEPEFLRRGQGNGAGRTRRPRHPRGNGRSDAETGPQGTEEAGSAEDAAPQDTTRPEPTEQP